MYLQKYQRAKSNYIQLRHIGGELTHFLPSDYDVLPIYEPYAGEEQDDEFIPRPRPLQRSTTHVNHRHVLPTERFSNTLPVLTTIHPHRMYESENIVDPYCNVCNLSMTTGYECGTCDFQVCDRCLPHYIDRSRTIDYANIHSGRYSIFGVNTTNGPGSKSFSHQHVLHEFTNVSEAYMNTFGSGWLPSCKLCSERISDGYHCFHENDCKFDICRSCMERTRITKRTRDVNSLQTVTLYTDVDINYLVYLREKHNGLCDVRFYTSDSPGASQRTVAIGKFKTIRSEPTTHDDLHTLLIAAKNEGFDSIRIHLPGKPDYYHVFSNDQVLKNDIEVFF